MKYPSRHADIVSEHEVPKLGRPMFKDRGDVRIPFPVRLPKTKLGILKMIASKQGLTLTQFVEKTFFP